MIYPNMAFSHPCSSPARRDCYILEIKSALFDKGIAALGAPDLDLSLSPGDPDLLPAGRATVNMVGLPLLHIPLPCGEGLLYLIFIPQIYSIFRPSLISVFGKHPEVCINQ